MLHTERRMKKADVWRWGWRVVPMGVVVVIGVVTDWLGKGVGGVNALGYGLLTAGWIAGWKLVELNKYLDKVGGARELLVDWDKSVRNVLTVSAVGILGIWVVTSAGSPLASGLVFGLSVRLFAEYWQAADYKSWYWVIAREVTEVERKVFGGIWGAVLLLTWLILVRG